MPPTRSWPRAPAGSINLQPRGKLLWLPPPSLGYLWPLGRDATLSLLCSARQSAPEQWESDTAQQSLGPLSLLRDPRADNPGRPQRFLLTRPAPSVKSAFPHLRASSDASPEGDHHSVTQQTAGEPDCSRLGHRPRHGSPAGVDVEGSV